MRDELNTTPADPEAANTAAAPATPAAPTSSTSAAPAPAQPGVVEEVLVEEVSIDGMCGVY